MADKVGIIREGRMVFQDTIDNLVSTASSGFRLSVSEPELALGLALDLGCEGVLRNQMLELESMQDAKIALLVKRLVENQHAVYRVEEQRRSLEDIFMQIVGEGSRV